ncbi:unnamed protein product (macronuclear) [Paramecium tetraurelia]|uniref:Protein kinase domain-containing protein n=1 Tax=Paramecium tetraurelia TaxID=5888 RepID=A0DZW7_PARTE|nr:uncharacterized protein GSPATT00021752001 [Paramecium tetraurelia]CAK88584.1 unnamed protein product [Paramecium tetraurelia]|eukprot:XP_001455981.1 hypothetical protein (macronuclear) [Paramecium tetraurelia strain d4-2]
MIPLKQIIQQNQLLPMTIILKLLYQLTQILNTINFEGYTIQNLKIEDLIARESGELEKLDIFIPSDIILKESNPNNEEHILNQLKDICNFFQVFQVIKFGLSPLDIHKTQNFEEILLYILKKLNIDLSKDNWREQCLQIIYGLEINHVQEFNKGLTYIYHVKVPYYINSKHDQIIIKWIHQKEQKQKRLTEVDNYKNLKRQTQFNNKNLIDLFCYTLDVDDSTLLFLQQYSLTLKDYTKNSDGKLNMKEKMKICSKLADELKKLHDQNKIHRDLKPENIMVTGKDTYTDRFYEITDQNINQIDKLQWQIIDFESVIEKGGIDEFVGTKQYIPPENMQGKPYQESYDIWQMGLCFLYFITQQDVQYKKSAEKRNANLWKLVDKLKDKQNMAFYSETMHSIISKMVSIKPQERPKLEAVIKDLNAAIIN